ncbi:MAG: DNA adenine methylase [Clostridia bacterium]|jgi:DNA adenine methylase|nr:DNA adenine methylase [Clostridia bacterium]
MFEPVIKWSGSKRTQANKILEFVPEFNTYYEPFLGGGSMLYAINPERAVCGDICTPLIGFWKCLKEEPEELFEDYKNKWNELQNVGYEYYYNVREQFNNKKDPYSLFFLTRTCVNGLIRFNKNGEFNNSFHHTRKGINPSKLEPIVNDWSKKIQNVKFINEDYRKICEDAKEGDFVYLDPPYFNTKGRYYGTIEYEEFIKFLYELKEKKVKYALSYDGKSETKDYTVEIPKDLYKRHIFIESGNSTFKKVIDKNCEKVKESLYLSW